MIPKNVCSIIVTYNRKNLLLSCVEQVLNQSFLSSSLLIVDNASTDGTDTAIKERFDMECEFLPDQLTFLCVYEKVDIYYLKNSRNLGGSGGFHLAMNYAKMISNFDAIWMMDDDGYPSLNCLERLVPFMHQYDYVMPVSIDIEDFSKMSWPTVRKEGGKTLQYAEVHKSWGQIMDYVYPFNGCLLSRKIVEDVGSIDKRFFIWGDEYDHYWRCRRKGYHPVTIVDAIFYHPANKMSFVPIFFGLKQVSYVESKWRMVCLIRNYVYIYRKYGFYHKLFFSFLAYTWLFLITRKLDLDGYKLYVASLCDGFSERFDRHYQYM